MSIYATVLELFRKFRKGIDSAPPSGCGLKKLKTYLTINKYLIHFNIVAACRGQCQYLCLFQSYCFINFHISQNIHLWTKLNPERYFKFSALIIISEVIDILQDQSRLWEEIVYWCKVSKLEP